MTQTEQHNVPALRFPGFEEAWESKTLGDFFTFKNGVNADKSAYGTGRKFINVLDIISEVPITSDNIIGSVEISDEEFEKNEVRYGDILFQRSSETREEVGQSNVYLDHENTATFGGFVIRGRPRTTIEPEYFHNLLKTSRVRKDITARSGGSTRYNVGQESLSVVPITLSPSLPEQRKVAEFLRVIDERIEQLSHKNALLEDYKRGCMQQLFSQSNRFKDDQGNDFPDWEQKRLSEGLEKSDDTATSDSYGKKLTVSLNLKGVTTREEVRSQVKEKTRYYIRRSGYFIYGKQNLHKGAFGLIPQSLNGYCSSGDLPCLRFKNDVIVPKFLVYLLSTLYEDLEIYTTGTGSKRLHEKDLLPLKFAFPHPEEQRKIADFLTSIDTKIGLANQELGHAQTFKKGLLQQMFV